jgi:hypothetical protein
MLRNIHMWLLGSRYKCRLHILGIKGGGRNICGLMSDKGGVDRGSGGRDRRHRIIHMGAWWTTWGVIMLDLVV